MEKLYDAVRAAPRDPDYILAWDVALDDMAKWGDIEQETRDELRAILHRDEQTEVRQLEDVLPK